MVQYLHLISNTTASNPLDVWTPSSNNIKPEIGDQFTVGYFLSINKMWEFSAETYLRLIKNQIDYIDGAELLINEFLEGHLLSGKGRAYGLELYLQKKTGKFNGWISYTLGRTELQVNGINRGEWYAARYDQTHNLKVIGFYDLSKRWSLSANFVLTSGTPTTFPTDYYIQQGVVIPYIGDSSRNVRSEMADISANLPHGIEPTLVADQAVSVDVAINDFMTSLWQAIVIILVYSFASLGGRPGAVVALAIPLTLAVVFAVMDIANIDLHRISLGALIIALGLLVDDAMSTVDAMLRRLGAGDSMDEAATFSYRTLAAPMLIGALVTIASFVPIGFAKSNAGEYTFDIFSVVAISLIASWLVAVIFGPLLGKAILKAPKVEAEPKPSKMVS